MQPRKSLLLLALVMTSSAAAAQNIHTLDVAGITIGEPRSSAAAHLEQQGYREITAGRFDKNGGEERVLVSAVDAPNGTVVAGVRYSREPTELTEEELVKLMKQRYSGVGAVVNGGSYLVVDPRDAPITDTHGYSRSSEFRFPYIATVISGSGIVARLVMTLDAGQNFLAERAAEVEALRKERATKEGLPH